MEPKRHQRGHQQVLTPGELVPAEEEEPTRVGFQEEGPSALYRTARGAEDVANVVGVVGPVGTKLELQGDAGSDPHDEVDTKQLRLRSG